VADDIKLLRACQSFSETLPIFRFSNGAARKDAEDSSIRTIPAGLWELVHLAKRCEQARERRYTPNFHAKGSCLLELAKEDNAILKENIRSNECPQQSPPPCILVWFLSLWLFSFHSLKNFSYLLHNCRISF
jgi:hypothetical protein